VNAILKHKDLTSFSRIRRLAENARILAGDEIPGAALNEFYEREFPSRANFMKSHWRWLYRTTSDATARSPIIVMAENQVVGHVGAIPLTLRRGGDERAAVWVCDIAVSREYRGKALGAVLLAEAMASCPLRVGFPNEMSWKLASKFGWKDQLNTVGLSLLLRPDRHPKIRERSTSNRGVNALAALAGLATRVVWRARTLSRARLSVSPATADHLSCFFEKDSPAALHVARSPESLLWRISAHPNIEEHFALNLPNGQDGRAAAIARVVEDDGCRRLHLLTLRAAPSDLSDFLAGVVRWALEEDIHVISMVTSDPALIRVARRWLPVLTQLRYAYHADDSSGEEFLGGDDHIWEYIDGDFDLTYTSPSYEES
jgi:GNAT superfamily N-acetyltransferase